MSTTTIVTAPPGDGKIIANEPLSSIALESIHAAETVPPVDQENVEGESTYPGHWKFTLIFLAMTLMLLLGGLDANIVATAVGCIERYI